MELAAGAGIDPDRISFLKVLKHVRRSVIARTVTTAAKMTDFMDTLASRVDRKPGSRSPAPARRRPAAETTEPEVFLPCQGPAPQTHPQGVGQDHHSASSNTSVTQATALAGHPEMDLPAPDGPAAGQR